MEKARIIWNGQGGELDSVTVTYGRDDDYAITKAMEKMIGTNIITPGDSFVVEAVE